MRYRLYGLSPTADNIAGAKGYYRAATGYLLVYTSGRRPKQSVPVRVEQLSPGDLAWLEECNWKILTETADRDKNVQEKLLRFLDRLKYELAIEESKQKGAEHG